MHNFRQKIHMLSLNRPQQSLISCRLHFNLHNVLCPLLPHNVSTKLSFVRSIQDASIFSSVPGDLCLWNLINLYIFVDIF